MPKPKKKRLHKIFLIVKTVRAKNISDAILREKRGVIVEALLLKPSSKKLEAAVGFTFAGEEEDEEDEDD